MSHFICFFFFFNDTATTEIYTLSLHDALPILSRTKVYILEPLTTPQIVELLRRALADLRSGDRKSTRLNSSHGYISYAVFCLKKKKKPCLNHVSLRQPMMRTPIPGIAVYHLVN